MNPRPAAGAVWISAALTLALGVFVLRERQIAGPVGLSGFPLDDPWIHFQFARNLAEGHGFAYNPGVPVAGSTAPLWTVLLAAAFALFGSHPALAKGIGIAAALGTALLARRLGSRWTGDPMLGALAGILTALAAPLVWGALSGMEVSLAALLVTAALLAHTAQREWTAALLLGLATLARPEAVLLVPLLWLARPLTLRRTAIIFGVVAAVLAPAVAFNLVTAGAPWPATASAKIEGGLVGLLRGMREPVASTLIRRPWQFEVEWAETLWRANMLLPLLLVPGLWVLARRLGRAALPAAVLLLQPVGMALLAPYRGPAFQEGRYASQLLPLAIVVATMALIPLGASSWPRRLAAAALIVAGLAALPAAAERYGWAVQNIEAMQVRLGRWAALHTPRDARLGLNDVGAIAYISRREVLDLMGLVTPAIIPYRRDGESGVLRYLERTCPDYLVIFPAWFPELSARADRFTPIYRLRLEHNTVAGADEMVVYETAWNRWRPAPRPCPGQEGR
ncbi:MAG TPA: hypothetical protein VFO18_14675 [Methylomirabilota bacterium]|nr:hypothetical protein [Methylomirabilota bacterium]